MSDFTSLERIVWGRVSIREESIYDGRYKLIHFYDDIDTWELYDREVDPKEMNNVYGKPEYNDITERLKTELRELQIEYNDPILEKYPL